MITDSFKEELFEDVHVTLEGTVEAILRVIGRHKMPGVDKILIQLFQIIEADSTKIFTTI